MKNTEQDEKWFDVRITHRVAMKAKDATQALIRAHKRIRDDPTDIESSADVELSDLSKKT